MSLYGMMRTGVSGMQGQSNRLGTVADNIANSSTTGYKKSETAFATLVIPSSEGYYSSGGITTDVRYAVAQQGVIQYTPSVTDLAINGSGFFVVQDAAGTPFLTRAGSFVPDDQGRLVNASGFYLLGYNFDNGAPAVTANGFAGLEPVQIVKQAMIATPSTFGTFSANLSATSAIVPAGNLPSTNSFTAQYTNKTSLVAYDNLGGQVMLDLYFTKTASNSWELSIYNQADATAGTSFPYGSPALATQTLNFDPTTGGLAAGAPNMISLAIPGGATLELDISAMSQLATPYTLGDVEVNGSAASAVSGIEITDDGTVYAQYENGTLREVFRIPLANVRSPDKLKVLSGNVFAPSGESGDVQLGFATGSGFGSISSGALEASNVDIGAELTSMIEAQRSYTANSKVFQTGSDLMDILVNLKR